MARPKCFDVSRWKVQAKAWTPENTRGPPLRGQRRRSRFSGFTRPSRRQGTRPSCGGPRLSIAHQQYGSHAQSRTTLMSALAHDLKEKTPEKGAFAKVGSGAGWKPAQAGVLLRKLIKPSTPLRPRSRWTRGAKKDGPSSPRHQASNCASLCKAGRFCRTSLHLALSIAAVDRSLAANTPSYSGSLPEILKLSKSRRLNFGKWTHHQASPTRRLRIRCR